MNVTDKRSEAQPTPQSSGGSLQKDSAEHESYAGACNPMKITENNPADARANEERLLESILERDNLNKAYKRVKSNKGAHGVDGMNVEDLHKYFVENGEQLKQSIREGKYKPNPVRRVEIPKEDGKKRPLGIPTVVDRVIQQAISQVLTPIYEEQFSDNTYRQESRTPKAGFPKGNY